MFAAIEADRDAMDLRQIFQFCASRQPWLPAICFVAG